MPGFCRDCFSDVRDERRCPSCGSPRLFRHPEADTLSIAHVDCDAFYAAVEKRDDPALRDRPVIIGGGRRGVVSTACYIARIQGVRSAMPMFKALKLCPDAVVIKPDFQKYSAAGRQVKSMMRELTPLVESVSIDEAFLDLSGTERLHGMTPARALARFAKRVDEEIGITVSVGLAPNKFLAKIASDLDKPRGFTAIGRVEAVDFLDTKPVGILPGVGAAARTRLESEGLYTVGDIRRADPKQLGRVHGGFGLYLWKLSRGEDTRPVRSERETKSVSAETTFNEDIADARELTEILWRLSERVSTRLKAGGFSGTRVTLKLKTADFRTRSRSRTLDSPTRLAGRIFETGRDLLARETGGDRFRLIGIGVEDLHPIADADPPDLLDSNLKRRIAAEDAIDRIRTKFGSESVGRGIGFRNKG